MTHLPIRYALLLALEPLGSVHQVSDLVATARRSSELGPRPSKFVSDLLRLEVRRGRVQRVGWGQYRLLSFPRSTRQRAVAAVSQKVARTWAEHSRGGDYDFEDGFANDSEGSKVARTWAEHSRGGDYDFEDDGSQADAG